MNLPDGWSYDRAVKTHRLRRHGRYAGYFFKHVDGYYLGAAVSPFSWFRAATIRTIKRAFARHYSDKGLA